MYRRLDILSTGKDKELGDQICKEIQGMTDYVLLEKRDNGISLYVKVNAEDALARRIVKMGYVIAAQDKSDTGVMLLFLAPPKGSVYNDVNDARMKRLWE